MYKREIDYIIDHMQKPRMPSTKPTYFRGFKQ